MSTKAILHSLWLGAVATILAVVLEPALKAVSWHVFGEDFLGAKLYRALLAVGLPSDVAVNMPFTIIYTGPTLAICLGAYACLVRWFPSEPAVTRCRKCRQILQKLSEARCPECGEAI
ncbi:MAG: hypothetical protein GY778_27940 [bacterium]|nr:hypothetical protein [bacterium]